MTRVAVIGGGAWGTALALTASRAGRVTTLFVREPDVAHAINQSGENAARLPGLRFDAPVTASGEPADLHEADVIIAALPAQAMRAGLTPYTPFIKPGVAVISAAKGLERGTRLRMSEVIGLVAPHAVPAVLSGPSFAADVAGGLPTAVTVATQDLALAEALAQALASPLFRPYASSDVLGVELGGALKNVLAIACGIVVGRGLGASAQAALAARGFAELSRLALALGARPETIAGLSGLGDLMLSATSPLSRNFSLGQAIGRGGAAFAGGLAEGAFTADVAVELAATHGLELPIGQAVADVLAGRVGVDEAVGRLMSRPLRSEGER